MKNIRTIALCFALMGLALPSASAFGLNPSSPLGGFDLGGGAYATLVGVQSTSSLVGQTISVADLNAAINSGSVSAWYYGAGNSAGSMFANISLFAPFVSDTVIAGSGNPGRIWDSLYAVHTGTVVFKNGSGGTTTMATGGNRTSRDPFSQVPDSGSTLVMGLMGLTSMLALRKKFVRS